jgi:hypothetical protein
VPARPRARAAGEPATALAPAACRPSCAPRWGPARPTQPRPRLPWRSLPAPRAGAPAGRAACGRAQPMARTSRASSWQSAASDRPPSPRPRTLGTPPADAPRARQSMPSAVQQCRRAAFRATSQTRLSHIARIWPALNHRVSQCVAALSQPPLDARCEPGSASRCRRAYRPIAPH